ncbi:LptA/OstA family protein [Candidatus Caldatribacterium saccharofermentans]|uniref:LptA/OstA family protein n=1 Tax=Candidatus Caldatribacterium saccharofermentans TaxID=1454753 RepID=UPI003D03BA07
MKRWLLVLGCFVLVVFVLVCALWGEEENVLLVRTQEAEYDERTGKIVAHEATLRWRNLEIFCPTLEVDVKAQEVRSSGDITALLDGLTVHIGSLLYSREANVLHVLNLSGTGKDMSFGAREGLFDFPQGVAVFTGNPVLTFQGFQVTFSRAEYHFAEKIWQGQEAVIRREGWWGSAKQARYTEGTSFLILEGRAELEREGNRLRGERITVNLDTLQVKVEGNVEIFLVPPKEGMQ